MAATKSPQVHDKLVIARDELQGLFDALHQRGYQTVGPTLRDGAIVCDVIHGVDDLPTGWTDEQQPGAYRLRRRPDDALFGYNLGPHAWKRFLHPPVVRLWHAERTNGHYRLVQEEEQSPQLALIGVRACDLHAIRILDRVLAHGTPADPIYSELRRKAFIVAVNCEQAGETCFCVSMGTGPEMHDGYDLALTELIEGGVHYFVADVGSAKGVAVAASVPHRAATEDEVEAADCKVAKVAREMGRTLDTEGLKEMLYRNLESPRWEEIAARCLACGNCTMVCPTCFCTTVQDVTDLTGKQAERWRKADSCFTTEFSHIYGGSIRATPMSRYRQWLTHKMASWVDQFGTFGCVGCGRCITWCPVGIDITEEVKAIRAADRARA